MKTKLLILPFLLVTGMVWGQKGELFHIGFVKDSITISKDNKNDIIVPVEIIQKRGKDNSWKDYTLDLKVKESSLPISDYEVDFRSMDFSQLREKETIYITIKKDSFEDKERRLVLQLDTKKNAIDVKDQNLAVNKELVLIVKPYKKPDDVSENYKILSYVGTNFDMADGKTNAKNLFFATNVYVPPRKDKSKVGFYLSLYGNRTMSNTDSIEYQNRTIKVQPVTDSTYLRQRGSGTVVTTATSDNIGAFFSPLIKINKSSNHNFNLFYAPSVEFVWRRINIEQKFGLPTAVDTVDATGYMPSTIMINQNVKTQVNEFDFSLGIVGVLLAYETKDMSVRVQSSVGYMERFYNNVKRRNNPNVLGSEVYPPMDKKSNVFYMGRVWITDAVTGITLQAEITNQFKNSRPFFGVTLSKAFKLKDIGKILSPLIDRK